MSLQVFEWFVQFQPNNGYGTGDLLEIDTGLCHLYYMDKSQSKGMKIFQPKAGYKQAVPICPENTEAFCATRANHG